MPFAASKLFLILIAGFFFCLQSAAHAPYERAAGQFKRSDGETILAVKYFTDGIFFADPESVQFRLPDGKVISKTEHTAGNLVVRAGDNGFTVYRFPSDWLPVASIIQTFDGFTLSDAMTTQKRILSPLVHTVGHSREYLFALCLTVFVYVSWKALLRIPNRGKLAIIRVAVFLFVAVCDFCVLVLILLLPISPLILLGVLSAGIAVYRLIRSYIRDRERVSV